MSVAIWAGYPRSYTPGRARPPQYVTLHYTAGSEGPTSAENGVAYDKTRTDGTSCHYFADSAGPALQEVPDGDRSHSARYHGNEIGIHVEICGTRQTREQWLDSASLATLRTAAALTREICLRHGFELRRLSVDETRAAYYGKGHRPTGINDHAACTLAYPEDGGDHLDVGDEFPWDVFMGMVTGEGEGDEVKCFYIRCDDGTTWMSNWSAVWQVGNWPGDEGQGHREYRRGLPGAVPEGGVVEGFLCYTDERGELQRYIESRDNLTSGLYGAYYAPATGGGGTPGGPVDVSTASVTAIAKATADELHADPERDGRNT